MKEKKEGEVAWLVCVTKPGGGRGGGWRVRGVGVQWGPLIPRFIGFLLSHSSCLTNLSLWLPVAPDTYVDIAQVERKTGFLSPGPNSTNSKKVSGEFHSDCVLTYAPHCAQGPDLPGVPSSGSHAHLSKEGPRKSLLSRQSSQTVSMIFKKMELIKWY